MSGAKLSLNCPSNAMNPDDNDPFEIFVQHVAGRRDNPFQWMPLIYNFGLPDLPGLSLLAPLAVELKKCDKCSREFCSSINYKRHVRMHRRSLNVDKESHKNRDLLGDFWDKLSLEEAGRVVSFDDISLEGISGSLIVDAWASSLHKAGVLVLPQLYLRAGIILLDIIQAKSSRLPISSQQLFSILEETSERTFLCAGTTESVQKFVIDGGAKNVLELRNLIASTSLLFEQKMVKEWLVKKEVEALRCQKILVEEEEVTQKRQAHTLERKKKKNLRKKEQKARGQSAGENIVCDVVEKIDNNDGVKTDVKVESSNNNSNFLEGPALAETSTLCHFSCREDVNFYGKEDEEFVKARCDYSIAHTEMDSIKSVGSHKEWETDDLYKPKINTWQVVPKSYRKNHVAPSNKMITLANGGNVWARKSKSTIDVESSRDRFPNIVAKGGVGVMSTRTNLQHVVEKSSNDVVSSGASWKKIVAKGTYGVESSRTTLHNVVAKSENAVECSKASWKNIVLKGGVGVMSSRTTLQQVFAKSPDDVASSKASWKTLVTKGADGVESSRTISQNVVAKTENDVECSKSSWKDVVANGAVGLESSRTILQNIVAKSANDVENSRASLQNIVAKGAVDVESSRTTFQNTVVKSENDVESPRTSLYNIAPNYMDMSSNNLSIGSRPVHVRNSTPEQHESQRASTESSDKCEKSDSVLEAQDPAIIMSRDVCAYKRRSDLHVQQGNQSCGKNFMLGTVEDHIVSSLNQSVPKKNDIINNDQNFYKERNVQPEGSIFSSFDARDFLAQRWKDAITSDHVKLVFLSEPPCDVDGTKDCSSRFQISGWHQYNKLSDVETPMSSSKKIEKTNSKKGEKGKGVTGMKYNK